MARRVGDSGQAAVLDAAQIKRLIKIAGTTMHSDRDQTVIVLSYWLGLRAKELASLTMGDVYLPSGEIKHVLHLKSSYTKRARMRDVYLSSDVVLKQLREYSLSLTPIRSAHSSVRARRPEGLTSLWSEGRSSEMLDRPLFATRSGNAFSANGMVHLLKHLHSLAGIDGGSSHSGRRTMITRLAESGVDLKSIAALAGHSSIRTTAVYVENNPERLSKIMGGVDLL